MEQLFGGDERGSHLHGHWYALVIRAHALKPSKVNPVFNVVESPHRMCFFANGKKLKLLVYRFSFLVKSALRDIKIKL